MDVRRREKTGNVLPDPSGADEKHPAGFDRLWLDLRYAHRRARRSPIVAFGAVATLALGIGANTSIFVVADTVLLRSLPYAGPNRLFVIWETGPQHTSERTRVSVPDFLDWQTQATAFEEMGAYGDADFNVTLGQRSIRVDGQIVSASLFPMLGVSPLHGRHFLPVEDAEGRGHTALVSHHFWQRELNGDPGAIGQHLTIDGSSFTIVGVMPEHFRSPGPADVWIPLGNYVGNRRIWRATHVLTVIGRLRAGVEPGATETYMTRLAQDLWEHAPLWNGWRISLRPLRSELYGEFTRPAGFLWAAGVALLLVMCANLANLFSAQGIQRRPEFAIRRALGADRRTLMRQMFVEIVMLTALATGIGLILSIGVLHGLGDSVPAEITIIHPLTLDVRALVYAVSIAAGSALVFGLLPAVRLITSASAMVVRGGLRGGDGRGARRFRAVLVGGQITVSLALLTTTFLTATSYRRLRQVDPGFESANVMSFRVALAGPEYETAFARRMFYQRVQQRVDDMPAITSAGVASHVPFSPGTRGTNASIFVVNRVPEPGAEQPLATVNRVSPGFLSTIGINATRGRGLMDTDSEDAPPVALVNRTAAAMLWPDRDPLGARIRTGVTDGRELVVVGVVDDMRLTDLRRPPSPQVFVAAAQFPPAVQTFVVGAERRLATLAGDIRRAVASIDPTQPIYDVAPLGRYIERSLASAILSARVLTALAVLSMALASVGIYAVVAFSVGLRLHEFSVRQVLGARAGDVLAMVLREGLATVGLGLAAGVLLSVLAARLLASQLFGISALDPRVYLVSGALLGLLALASAWIPGLKAARVDPARALRGP